MNRVNAPDVCEATRYTTANQFLCTITEQQCVNKPLYAMANTNMRNPTTSHVC